MHKGVYKRLLVIDRIISKIEKDLISLCWNFKGGCTDKGYGLIWYKRKTIYVHRYMYWYYELRPKGTTWKEFSENNQDLDVCHRCDNPSCCNPKHLFLGTPKDNTQDCVNKNRFNPKKGEDNGKVKLTEKQVLKIYQMKGTQQDIADKFGISQRQVSSIKRGENWGWFTKCIKKGDEE